MSDATELAAVVKKGIEASPHSSSKWNDLYEWLCDRFDLPLEFVRASLLAEKANITNRIAKDNAWVNPKLLALICVRNVSPDEAELYLDEFTAEFQSRMGALPRLRVALIFDERKLVKVKLLGPAAGPRSPQAADTVSSDAEDDA